MTVTAVVSLTAFLTSRLDEDESVARAVVDDQHGLDCDFSEDEAERHESWDPHPGGRDCPTGWQTKPGWEHNHLSGPSSLFIRHTSPERVLREVEAKRAIIRDVFGWVSDVDREHCIHTWEQIRDGECEVKPANIATLRALAAIYADHPDYREEWRG